MEYGSLVLPGYVCERPALHLDAFEVVSDALLHALHVVAHVVVAQEGSSHHHSHQHVPEPPVVLQRQCHKLILQHEQQEQHQKPSTHPPHISPPLPLSLPPVTSIWVVVLQWVLGGAASIIVIIFAYFDSWLSAMRTNLPAGLPFHKKEGEMTTRNTPAFLAKHPQPTHEHSQKKIGGLGQARPSQPAGTVSWKQIQTTEEESITSDPVSSCTSSEIATKPSKLQQSEVQEQREKKQVRQPRPTSPLGYEATSPRKSASPQRQSRLPAAIRATLKNLLHSRGSPSPGSRQEETLQAVHSSRDLKLTASIRSNKTFADAFSPVKSIEKENMILREQNELLRRELSEIKRNLMMGGISKKDQVISTLRNTIKKEDSQIKELRLKLQIFTKKNAALTSLIQNKDEQLAFLTKKVAEMEEELQEHRQRNGERLQKLKERINFTLRSYGELQGKWNRAEMEWLGFKEKWMQEKGVYLHRIAFLEDYIANS